MSPDSPPPIPEDAEVLVRRAAAIAMDSSVSAPHAATIHRALFVFSRQGWLPPALHEALQNALEMR